MDDRQENGYAAGSPVITGLVVVASLVIIFAGIKAAEALIVPFLLAVFISVIISPILMGLRKIGVGSGTALVLMAGVLFGVLIGLATLLGAALEGFLGSMPEYQRLLAERTETLAAWLETRGIEVPEQFLWDYADPQALMRFTGRVLAELSGMLGNSFLILLTVVFMLLEGSAFASKLDAFPERLRRPIVQYREVIASIRRYMAIKTVLCLMTGVLVTGLLMLMGIEYAVLWGVLAFLMNYIPTIGSFIAALPAVLLALMLKDAWTAVWLATGYAIINVGIGNVLEPRVMGRGMGLSTLVVFMSLVFWGWLLGPAGMVLSVPLTMSVKIAMMYNERTRPVALLLGAGEEPQPSAG